MGGTHSPQAAESEETTNYPIEEECEKIPKSLIEKSFE